MINQQEVVDQIVQNLAFDVEAIPKKDLIQSTSISQSTPLNVKIKVRKKDEIHNMQHDIAMADNTSRTKQKIRLVNSDGTIMTFDVFMEAEFEKKPARKLRKHIFDMLRPGICLGAVDDDEYPYIPSSSYSANITEPSVVTKSDGTLKQTFTLTKNVYTVSTQPEGQKWLFGKCKPGGCLDPPFGEDKYAYKPSTRSGPEREEKALLEADVETAVDSNKKPITQHDEETQSNGRHSSVFDSGLFKKKRKSSDKSTSTKIPDKTDSIVDIYQKESATNSVSIHSNPIITYPPKIKTDPRISDDKTARSRGPSEEKSRKSFNDHSEPYFVPPKGVQRIKEKDTLDLNDQAKHRSSDVADVNHLLKETFKMPVPLPIPIPVPIPTISSKRTPEVIATNDDILKIDSIPDHKLQNKELLDQELQDQKPQDTINLKDTEIPPLLLRTKSASGDTDDTPVKSSKTETSIPSNVKQSTASNEKDDQNLNEIQLEPPEAKENIIEDTGQPNEQKKTESFKIPIPVPLPFNFSDSNRADAADTPFECSKDMQQSIDPRLGKKESVAKTTLNLEYSNIEGDEIPEKYLRTRGGFTKQESNTESHVTLDSIMEKGMKRDSDGGRSPDRMEKLEKQKDTQEDIKRDFEGIEKPEEQQEDIKAITEEEIKRVSKEGTITDGMEIPAKQDDIKDKITTSAIYTEEDRIRDSEGNLREKNLSEKIIDGIAKPEKQKDRMEKPEKQKVIRDNVTIPTKYTQEDVNRDLESRFGGQEITDGIEKPAEQKDTQEDMKRDFEGFEKPEEQQEDIKTITEEEIKRVSKEGTITDGIDVPAKQDDVKDKITTSAIYTEQDRIRDSKGNLSEKIIGGIGKPEKQKDRMEKPEKQKVIRDNVTIPTKYTQEDVNRDLESRFGGQEITDGIEKPAEQKDTQEDMKRDFEGFEKPEEQQEDIKAITEEEIKRVSKEGTITDGIDVPAKQDDVKDKITTSAIYTEQDRIRDSKGNLSEKIIGGIGKPEKQKDRMEKPEKQKVIRDNATIPKKYTQEYLNRNLESRFGGEEITDRIEKPAEQKYIQEDIKREFEGIEKPEEQQEDIKAITEEEIKRVSKEGTITDGMEIPAKQDDIKDKIKTSAIYTEEDRIRDSKGNRREKILREKIIDGIGKPEEQKDIKDKTTIPKKHAGDTSDVYGKDENRSSLPSEQEYETYTGDDEMSKPHHNKEYETTKKNKDFNIDSHTGGQTRYRSGGPMDIIAAPVIIDNNTEPTSMFEPDKDDYSKTNVPSGVPITTQIASRFKEFYDENKDLKTTVSQELIGTKSVVDHSDGFVPSTSTKKHAKRTPSYDKRVILPEDTVLPYIQSIGSLKSAMKNDTISIDLGFHSYLNNNNERIVQTFDSANAPKRLPNDSVTVIKSQIRLSSNEIRITVDSEHDMAIQMKKANANQRVSISESRLVNITDTGKTKKQTSPEQYRDVETRSFEPKAEGTKDNIYGSEASADRLLDYYEKELVPLQLTIKNLRDEIDFLATQQTMFRDKLYCPNKSKLPRLVHSNKKCFGCVKK